MVVPTSTTLAMSASFMDGLASGHMYSDEVRKRRWMMPAHELDALTLELRLFVIYDHVRSGERAVAARLLNRTIQQLQSTHHLTHAMRSDLIQRLYIALVDLAMGRLGKVTACLRDIHYQRFYVPPPSSGDEDSDLEE